MNNQIFIGILIPFIGTSLGAGCVLFMKKQISQTLHQTLTSFSAGVMLAASIWSLIIPSIEQSPFDGRLAFIPAVAGFWLGILFLLFTNMIISHLHADNTKVYKQNEHFTKTAIMVFAIILHNIPEGMAVGVIYAGLMCGNSAITLTGALSLAIGISIQNFPEGAIISMPLHAVGINKGKSFLYGVLSGVVEPIGAVITILAAEQIIPALPYLLSFAAGSMIYVILNELVSDMLEGEHHNMGIIFFAVGFSIMMALDVALG